jgi:hypothetical protein
VRDLLDGFKLDVGLITAPPLIYTIYKSIYFKSSHCSLVVLWQRIHSSLTVIGAHYEVFPAQPNSFFAIILPTAESFSILSPAESESESGSGSDLIYDWSFAANLFAWRQTLETHDNRFSSST